jgi:hypothetical protein
LRDEATRQGTAAFEQLKQGAHSVTSEAKDRLSEYATGQKEFVSQNLQEFAQAIRRASDELSDRDQTMASQLVRKAAGGLESLSQSIGGSSLDEIVKSVRGFGRSNPTAFFGGAMLVGFALGRFATASASSPDHDGEGNETWDESSFMAGEFQDGGEDSPSGDASGGAHSELSVGKAPGLVGATDESSGSAPFGSASSTSEGGLDLDPRGERP